jgi:ribonuclease-3
MIAIINGKNYGKGVGGSKKEAEQNAAKIALTYYS